MSQDILREKRLAESPQESDSPVDYPELLQDILARCRAEMADDRYAYQLAYELQVLIEGCLGKEAD